MRRGKTEKANRREQGGPLPTKVLDVHCYFFIFFHSIVNCTVHSFRVVRKQIIDNLYDYFLGFFVFFVVSVGSTICRT